MQVMKALVTTETSNSNISVRLFPVFAVRLCELCDVLTTVTCCVTFCPL